MSSISRQDEDLCKQISAAGKCCNLLLRNVKSFAQKGENFCYLCENYKDFPHMVVICDSVTGTYVPDRIFSSQFHIVGSLKT